MPPSSSPPNATLSEATPRWSMKRGVVAAGTERADAEIGAGARVFAVFRTAHGETSSLIALPYGNILFRIGNVSGHGVDEFFQRVRTLHAKKSAAIAIGVDVDGGVLLEFVAVVLGPLRGAEQHGLFAVPRAINNGAFGLPALLEQFAHRARFFQQRDLAGDGIFRAVHPAIVMIAAHDPLVRRL